MQEKVDKEWYSSLMLNRLMFIYFIQKKGFLNNDKNYMRNKLNEIQEKRGDNKFYSFYREFLLVLFHEGFAMELDKRSAETMQIIGKIPYLNGGLFDVHELERKYTDITIPDSAFETIFTFFDKYDWHLDDRPVSDDKQINPDVIGHIFEKYINQKQMGAYYTKEDITEYISKNTIIPYLFEEAKKKCEVAFKENSYIWKMLRDNPDKYIYDAVKKGCDKELPNYIAKGVNNVSQREKWNKPTLEEYALPTEIWRETVERRNRYFEVKSKLANGEINSVNDFITYNLDIRQFVEDIITNAESSDVVKAFYYTIAGHIGEKSNEKEMPAMSILDPTCGSGAFLFAGLNILEPLYDACIDKMYDFKHEKPDSYKEFDSILADIEKHPNREYFIYKSIILNNLYGVDIMKEATEIAKLRLFLKLASCAEVDYRKDNFGLEALPDIDFNIRAGNSLVGFANYDEVKFAVEHNSLSGQMNLLSGNAMVIIDENAQKVSLAYKRFKNTQIVSGTHEELISAKKDLQQRLNELNSELNQYMAKKYGIDVKNQPKDYKNWLLTHEPFNWYVEFYDVIHNRGGFDVIIGNPPYVEYNDKIKKFYTIKNYTTEECGNLHAFVIERAYKVSKSCGNISLIVPMSIVTTKRMNEVRNTIYNNSEYGYFVNLAGDWHPGRLFEGVRSQFCIFVVKLNINNNTEQQFFSTNYIRWNNEERNTLFLTKIRFCKNSLSSNIDTYPKLGTEIELRILNKIAQQNSVLSSLFMPGMGKFYYRNAGIAYYQIAINFEQEFIINGKKDKSSTLKQIVCENQEVADTLVCILNSNLFSWFYFCYSDCYHLTVSDISRFQFLINNNDNYSDLCEELMNSINENSILKVTNYKTRGQIKYQEFYPRKSKSFIDKIDVLLSKHYSLTEEELDYITNYDIKYRVGDTINGGEDEE